MEIIQTIIIGVILLIIVSAVIHIINNNFSDWFFPRKEKIVATKKNREVKQIFGSNLEFVITMTLRKHGDMSFNELYTIFEDYFSKKEVSDTLRSAEEIGAITRKDTGEGVQFSAMDYTYSYEVTHRVLLQKIDALVYEKRKLN